MRAVCFVKRLEFDFPGNVFQNALAIGDVDNDGRNELVVGNMNGDLAIYKNDRVWQRFTGLGMITAIAIGDILNNNCNALVVVSGDGWCHILTGASTVKSDEISDPGAGKLMSFHVQRIPANTKVALLGDIDGDGCIELVLGLTDRVVRSYRWLPSESDSPTGARLLGLSKWECANQIGTVTLHHCPDGIACLLVSQPGGSYMKICCNKDNDAALDSSFTDGDGLSDSSVEYHPLSYSRMRNCNVSTEILGEIVHCSGVGKKASRYAVATLDGTIMLADDQQVLWSMQVEHQIFGIRSLDVTGDGNDEIIACAWNGQTYILDQHRSSVRFQLEEPVETFTAGHYALQKDESGQPSIVYTTFTDKIYVYHNVHIPNMLARHFQPKVGLKDSDERLLVEWCLYGKR